MTSPTDTPKRLSDVDLHGVISRHHLSAPYHGHTVGEIDYNACRLERAALLDHIAALTAPPSQGKVERARELLAQTLEGRSQGALARAIRDDPVYAMGVRAEDAIAAITQALTESSGQGTGGAEEQS